MKTTRTKKKIKPPTSTVTQTTGYPPQKKETLANPLQILPKPCLTTP